MVCSSRSSEFSVTGLDSIVTSWFDLLVHSFATIVRPSVLVLELNQKSS